MKYECEKCEKIVDSSKIIGIAFSPGQTMKYCFKCYAETQAITHGLIKNSLDEKVYKKIMKYLEE